MRDNTFAYDAMQFDLPKASVRTVDANGFMHVAISPLTKEQVAPYYGREIPNYQSLGFEPEKIYHGYRSAEELKRPETVQSTNGIPLQFQHHPDFANAPAKETRVGATGTDGEWKDPYLMNSLVIFDKTAQDMVENRTMRELSLAYRYTPVKQSGEALGQHYDFLMTNISANHIALVEQGRAGSDVLVLDHDSINKKETSPMFDEDKKEEEVIDKKMCADDEPNPQENPNTPPVDSSKSAEERLAVLEHEYQEMAKKLASLMEVEKAEGHKELQAPTEDEEEVPAKEDKEEPSDIDSDKPEAVFEEEDGDNEDDNLPPLFDDEDDEKEPVEDKDEIEEKEDVEVEDKPEDVEPKDKQDDILADGLKECQMQGESPEIQKAFTNGMKYGLKRLQGMGKPEVKEEQKESLTMGQDSAIDVRKHAKEMIRAMQSVRSVMGNLKIDAYDSANGIYSDALKQLGIKGISDAEAPRAFEMYMRGRKSTEKKAIAQDAKSVKDDAISDILNKVNTSI